ncbi:FCD domain-containing protein [Siminovitchia fortis]|uniref:FCD domain-containing protein n=1 Tax=Siminovitchia fortis TaxID=254758 RepID=A0A443IZU2_9BACI|nr:FCD domain-containing protein [Siminovitchia fortis]RWR13640.1 FCD domain-containing protein [Siminovitchia fortis]WHY81899.1 FCD domain-containing protein [Siminovitchia fortis]
MIFSLDAARQFHLAVAAAAKNVKLVEILMGIFGKNHRFGSAKEEQILLREYRDIVQAIEGRDAEKAERSMKRHLADVKRRMADL